MAESPGPGIYENTPFAEYLEWPYVSNSSLNSAERSMLHYKQRRRVEETEAMRFGSLCHAGKLEPSAIYRRYVVMPDLTEGLLDDEGNAYAKPKATKAYGKRVEQFAAAHADKIIVSQSDFDPDTGIRCKARIDKWAQRLRIIADLKTCRDCRWFNRDMADRNYHRQGAMYVDGLSIVRRGELFAFGLAAVENEEPFGTMTALVDDAALEVGRDAYKTCLRNIKAACDSGIWPGYTSPEAWTLPNWKQPKSEPFTLMIAGATVSL